jgi:hypothetical protein
MASSTFYDAFISYNHSSAPRQIAIALQRAIQNFSKPFWRARSARLYRDETDLTAYPALFTMLKEVLSNSKFLLLLYSPDSSK